MTRKEQERKNGKKTYRNGLFYNEKGMVVAASPYGILNNRYTTSENLNAMMYTKDIG